MRNLFRVLAVGLIAVLVAMGFAGCGAGQTSSSSGGSPQPQQTALVTGSWSGTLVSNSNYGTSLLFANVQSQGSGSYFSTMQQTNVCDSGLACMGQMPQNMPNIPCEEVPAYTLTETVSGNQVSGSIYINGYCSTSSAPTLSVSFTGTLSTNGKSITGTYKEFYNVNSGDPSEDSGTFNASVSGTVTGTYSGQIFLANNPSVNFPITFVLTQNSDGSVTGNGTVNNWSCVSTVTFTNSNSTPSFAFGGAFQASAQLNQTETFLLDGIPNGDGTYSLGFLVVNGSNSCSQGAGEGSATKQ